MAAIAIATVGPDAQTSQPIFRSTRDLISIDVVVRDRDGTIVRGLEVNDFEVTEDGRPQTVSTFSFQEITSEPLPPLERLGLLANIAATMVETRQRSAAQANQPSEPDPSPIASTDFAGRRLMVLLFDVSSMEPEDVQRAVDSATKYVRDQMTTADLVAVATVGSELTVLTDFTADRTRLEAALSQLAYSDGTATQAPGASTIATDEAAVSTDATTSDSAELDLFNNDLRLRALKALADALAPLEQKKAVLYFSAGMARNGEDNQVELRAAINASVRANVAVYPVDSRGLQAVVPGGGASEPSRSGVSVFSGGGMRQQFDNLAASQDTLVSMAADTGGRAFTDTNDFGEAFARVQRDISAYYLIGYSSTNTTKNGRFRRVQVRLKSRKDARVEARAGYYAERDFVHTNRSDRESQLQDQLFAAVSATDLPVLVKGGWFRLAADRYFVPVSLAVPGSAVPVAPGSREVALDVRGMVRDERGRSMGEMRETLRVPVTGESLAGRQVLYQSGMTLPPGRFSVKVVVRENASGLTGSFEAPLLVPELKQAPLKVSSIVLSTQLEKPTRERSDNPLVRDGIQIVPNLTHVVARDQKMFFYYEVYDPAVENEGTPALRTNLAFFRGRVKILETPIVERTSIDVKERRAAVFRFEVPADAFSSGLYTCQINVIDTVAGTFTFPRLMFFVR